MILLATVTTKPLGICNFVPLELWIDEKKLNQLYHNFVLNTKRFNKEEMDKQKHYLEIHQFNSLVCILPFIKTTKMLNPKFSFF